MEDLQLLRDYAEQRSDRAFTDLVTRHINFVYSTALRVVHETHLAEDVTQLVFIKLARKARSLRHGTVLTGWLYRTTHFVSQTVLRSDWRRRKREYVAMQFTETNRDSESVWKEVAPLLEQAMTQLRQADQDALLLRFFSGKSLREIGEALGVSDDTAQKRINRALEKMRAYFVNHGVVASADAIAPAISAHAIQAAPVGLASNLVTASLTAGSGTTVGGTTVSILKAMTVAKLKTTTAGITAAAIVLLTGAGVAVRMQRATPQAGAVIATPPSNAPFIMRGVVRKPDGKPLPGALVRVAMIGAMVRLYEITNSLPANARVSNISVVTGDDGTFTVALLSAPPERKAVVAVNHDTGYAIATADQLSSNPEIVLQPWGRIEGVLRIGKSPGTNQLVNIGIWGSQETYEWMLVSHAQSVRTDANGRFVFSRVAPGDVWLTRSVVVRPGEGRQSGHRYVKVTPGDHVQVQLGGVGRTIIGRVDWISPPKAAAEEPSNSNDKLVFYGSMHARERHGMRPPRGWRDMSVEEKRRYVREWRDSPEGELFKREVRNYEFPVQPDGTFRVEDVLPGNYSMQVRADAQLPKGQRPRLAAMVEIQVDVPEMSADDADELIDLGTLSPARLQP